MWEYQFYANFGDEQRITEISLPYGGPNSFSIRQCQTKNGKTGMYSLGELMHRRGEWVMPNADPHITWTDIHILGALTQEHGGLAELEKVFGK